MNNAKFLADNIKQLRERRGLTQSRMAELSSIPRPTWASLESGAGNPTLTVLSKIAAALQVSIEELISAPKTDVKFFKAGFGIKKKCSDGYLSALLPELIPGLDISRIELAKQGRIIGVPHTIGTREYLTCERGNIELIVSGETWLLEQGDAIVFRGDQKHSYKNPSNKESCVAMSVVCFAAN